MSQSSTDGSRSSEQYYDSWSALYEMIRQGKSFSGHERNCFFLNLGGREFVDASAMSGLDYPDDGRGLAIVDWDLDGRQDFWVSNRSGPRLRLLRNDLSNDNDFLGVLLVGTSCNRDAIGARVEVRTAGDDGRTTIQTLRAGDAFLAQSSKWLHFGLGSEATIDGVVVRWPGGEAEELEGLEPNRRYRVVQGEGASPWSAPSKRVALRSSEQKAPAPDDRARVVVASKFPLPEVVYEAADGSRRSVQEMSRGRPVLINLWASWCPNCVAELKELRARQTDLGWAGVEILALSVDEPDERSDAEEILDGMDWSFDRGFIDPVSLDVLDVAQQVVVNHRPGFSLPTSLLLDRRGTLAVLYRGPVDPEQLIEDVGRLDRNPEEQRAWASPYPGKWVGEPSAPRYLGIVNKLRDRGRVDVAADYLARVRVVETQIDESSMLKERVAGLRIELGAEFLNAGAPEKAIELLRDAVELHPQPRGFNQLGDAFRQAGRLDEALVAYQTAVELAPDWAAAHAGLGVASMALERYDRAREALTRAVELNPDFAAAYRNLGVLSARVGDIEDAVRYMRLAIEKAPENPGGHRNLGVMLQSAGRIPEAIPALEEASRLAPDDAQTLVRLGTAYVDSDRRADARRVLELLRELDGKLAATLERQLEDG